MNILPLLFQSGVKKAREMQIVSRRTMLALPVERLVGSSTSNNANENNRRPTMSPDSSGSNISDSGSSVSSSPSDSPNAKVYSVYNMSHNNNNNNTATTTTTKSDNSIKHSPIRSESSSPVAASPPPRTPIITSTLDQTEDSTAGNKFRCSCNAAGADLAVSRRSWPIRISPGRRFSC